MPLKGAYVSVVSFTDQSVLAMLSTGTDGKFALPSIAGQDSLLVEVSCSGFEKQCIHYKAGGTLQFTLQPDSVAYTLGAAEVAVSHSTLRLTKGRFVFQPHGADLELPDAAEMLNYVPMLTLSDDGSVNVLGKGQSTIYINGDKPQETGPALLSRLKSIRPQDVLRVEIIRSPGSKYSASMQGAIVNLVLRKPEEGWNALAVANAKYAQKRVSSDVTTSFTYNRKKFSTSFAAMWYGYNTYSHMTNTYDYTSKALSAEDDVVGKMKSKGLYASWMSEYRFTPNQKLLASAILSSKDLNNHTTAQRATQNGAGDVVRSRTLSESHMTWIKPDWGGMLIYKQNADKVNFKLSGELSNHEEEQPAMMKYQRWQPEREDFSSYEEFQQKYRASNLYGETAADLNYMLNDENSFSFNYLGSYMHTDNRHDRWNHDLTGTDEWKHDEGRLNHFVTYEMTQAFNVSYSREWSDAVSTEVGVRGEYMHNTYEQRTTGEKNVRNSWDWYPSANLTWEINDNHSLSVDYSRSRIAPKRSELNPFETQVSENVYMKGNPNLKNMTYHMLSLQYSCFKDLTLLFDYTSQRNALADYDWTDGQGRTYSSILNNGHMLNYAWSVNYDKWFFKDHYQLTFSAEIDHDRSFGHLPDGTNSNYKDTSTEFSWGNRIIISRKHRVQCSLDYQYNSANRSITKKFNGNHSFYFRFLKIFKNSMSISFAASTRTPRSVTSFTSHDYSYRYSNHVRPCNFQLKLTIPVAKSKVKAPEYSAPGKAKTRF